MFTPWFLSFQTFPHKCCLLCFCYTAWVFSFVIMKIWFPKILSPLLYFLFHFFELQLCAKHVNHERAPEHNTKNEGTTHCVIFDIRNFLNLISFVVRFLQSCGDILWMNYRVNVIVIRMHGITTCMFTHARNLQDVLYHHLKLWCQSSIRRATLTIIIINRREQ